MKTATFTITKDIQTVWMLANGDTIIGTDHNSYFVRTMYAITVYNKEEMMKCYGLDKNHLANIKHSGI